MPGMLLDEAMPLGIFGCCLFGCLTNLARPAEHGQIPQRKHTALDDDDARLFAVVLLLGRWASLMATFCRAGFRANILGIPRPRYCESVVTGPHQSAERRSP